MAKKTINQALKDLFLGLGGDPSKLSDNTSVSDYIEDLESAIEAAATAELPTPAETNVGKVATVVENEGSYSWSAEEVVIPQELPTPASTNAGKVATVVSDGEGGYTWGAETPSAPSVSYDVTFSNDTTASISGSDTYDTIYNKYSTGNAINKYLVVYLGIGNGMFTGVLTFQGYYSTYMGTPAKCLIFSGVIYDGEHCYSATVVFNNSKTGTLTKTQIV